MLLVVRVFWKRTTTPATLVRGCVKFFSSKGMMQITWGMLLGIPFTLIYGFQRPCNVVFWFKDAFICLLEWKVQELSTKFWLLQDHLFRNNIARPVLRHNGPADALCPMTRNKVCRKPYTIHRETEFGAALWMTSVLHSHTHSTKSLPLSRTCLMCLWCVMMRRKSVTYRRSLKGLLDVVSYLNKWCFRQTHGQTTILAVF